MSEQTQEPDTTPRRPAFPLAGDHYFAPRSTSRRSHHDGPYVEMLQEGVEAEVTGVFDDATREAVMAFQKKKKLPVTGVVDEATWKKLPR